MAKKILAILLALTFVVAFAACGGKGDDVTTTAPVETTEAESDNGESSNSGKIALAVGVCAVLGVAAALAVVIIKKKRK